MISKRQLSKMDDRQKRQRLMKRLDALISQLTKERDNYTCQFPGCRNNYHKVDAHHFIGRTNKALRWELDNLITLCSRHHFDVEADPFLNIDVFELFVGKEKIEQLRRRKNNLFKTSVENLEVKLLHLQSMEKSKSWSTSPHTRG